MPGDVVAALGISTARWEILTQLAGRSRTVTQLMESSGLSRNGVRRHLVPLVDAELVAVAKARVPWSTRPVDFYSSEPEWIREALDDFAGPI